MIKEIENDITRKYQYGNYYIYIKENDKCYKAYLQHKDYAIIYLMFGVDKAELDYSKFIDVIEDNLMQHIKFYKEEYED